MAPSRLLVLLLLLLVVLVGAPADAQINVRACRAARHLLVTACQSVLYGSLPSARCCERVRRTPWQCICPVITPKIAALIDVNRAIRLVQGCGRRVPRHFKCGRHLEDAVTYAKSELAKYFTVKPLINMLEDIVALLAYKDQLDSCVGYLLNISQREFVADAVNAAVLSTNPAMKDSEHSMYSCLERLLRQLTVCSLEKRALNGDQGEAFSLYRELNNTGREKCC